MGSAKTNIIAIVFTCLFLSSIVGWGILLYAIVNMESVSGNDKPISSLGSDSYIISLNSQQKALSVTSLSIYIILLLSSIVAFFKFNK